MSSNPTAVHTKFIRNFNDEATQRAGIAVPDPPPTSTASPPLMVSARQSRFPASATTVAAAVSVDSAQLLIRDHVKAINALAAKLAHAATKIEQYQTAIGQHIKAIKLARPDDWENIVKAECNLGRSRAYELLAVADGTKTSAEIASATTERSKKRRERLSVAQRTQDGADPEASAAEMRAKFAAIETAALPTKQREPEAAQVYATELEVAREHDTGLVEQLRVAEIKIADLENELKDVKDANAVLRIENDALREKLAGRLATKPNTAGWRKWSKAKAADMILAQQRWNYANPNDPCDLRTMEKIRDFHRLRPKLAELLTA